MYTPFVVFIILNTNHKEDTLALLTSITANPYANKKAIVLDNSSTDGTVGALRASFADVEIIPLLENLGYAGNNNAGIRIALERGAEWVFLLNEDTILAENCISALMTVAEHDQQIGILGPMVYHYDSPRTIQSAGGTLGAGWDSEHLGRNEPDSNQFVAPHQVDWISGCAILARREMVEQIGLLDARFFYYWEETDWCVRAARAGWKIVQVPQAKIWHKGVQTAYRPAPSVTYYNTRNRLLLLQKHRAPVLVRIRTWIHLLRTLASWTLKPRWRPMRQHRNAMLLGLRDYWMRRWGRMPSGAS